MAATSEVIGADRLARTLRAAGSEIADLTPAQKEIARLVQAEAVRRVPVRTGRLARSVQTTAGPASAVVRFGGPGVAYAAPIHWGVGPRVGLRGPHNIRPTRFATDAVQALEPQIESVYLKQIDRELSTVKGA